MAQKPSVERVNNLAAGSGVIDLSAKLKAGDLSLRAHEFSVARDRSVVIHASLGRKSIYRSFFAHDDDTCVSAVISDDGVRTRVSLYDDPERPGVGLVNIWNDGQAEQSFEIDVDKFLQTRDPHESTLKSNGARLDLVGNRQVPDINAAEVADAFADTQAFREFMRGSEHHERVTVAHRAKGGVNWKCAWICLIPACGLACLFWSPLRKTF